MELLHKFGWLLFWLSTPVVAVGATLYFGEFKQKLISGLILLVAARVKVVVA